MGPGHGTGPWDRPMGHGPWAMGPGPWDLGCLSQISLSQFPSQDRRLAIGGEKINAHLDDLEIYPSHYVDMTTTAWVGF